MASPRGLSKGAETTSPFPSIPMASNGYEVSRPEVVSNMTPEEAEEAKKIKARSSLELVGWQMPMLARIL